MSKSLMTLLKFGASFSGIFLLGIPAWAQNSSSSIHIGPNIQLSRVNSKSAHAESFATADPSKPDLLLACSMFNEPDPEKMGVVLYRSVDGGKEWSDVYHVIPASDPVCMFGPNGTAYLVLLYNKTDRQATRVYKSIDWGATWNEAYDLAYGDRESVVVDRGSRQGKGHIFIAEFSHLTPLAGDSHPMSVVWDSVDEAKSFRLAGAFGPSAPIPIVGAGDVFDDGQAIVPIMNPAEGAIDLNLNSNTPPGTGPTGWIRTITVWGSKKPDQSGTIHDVSSWHSCRDLLEWPPIPSLAVDQGNGPFAQRAYVAWPDTRFGRCRILLSYSDDRGVSWSSPTVVDDEDFLAPKPLRGAFKPTVAVNHNGVVGVYWYDRREAGASFSYRPRFAASFDGGDTFTASAVLSDSRMVVNEDTPFELDMRLSGNFFYGDISHAGGDGGETNGFTVDGKGDFHAVWVDNRTGASQLWTSRVSVEGQAYLNGSPELANFIQLNTPNSKDKNQAPSVEITSSVAYPDRRKIVIEGYLSNPTKEPLNAPVILRIISSRSVYGRIRPANATNGIKGPGALWDLTAAIPNGVLAPNQHSQTFTLEFEMPTSEWPWKKAYPDVDGFGLEADLRILVKKTQP